ncbi:MAG: VTT domain-containing protein [Promethearchaeota archaeon]
MKLKLIDLIFLILIVIVSLISIDLILNEAHRVFIENISKYPPFQDLTTGLLITFLICFIGNILPVPTPYTFVVCFSAAPFLSLNIGIPLLVAFVASLGCLIGELGGYLVGRGVSQIISEEQKIKLSPYQQILLEHPKLAPFLIFLAALTPINDDFITVPLGLLKYSFKKTVFWCWLGKFGLMLVFGYNLLNLCSFLGGESWILSIVTLYAIILLIYVLLKVDLLKLFNRILKENK